MNAIEHVYSALWDLKKKGAVPHTRDIAPLLEIVVSAAQDLHNSMYENNFPTRQTTDAF